MAEDKITCLLKYNVVFIEQIVAELFNSKSQIRVRLTFKSSFLNTGVLVLFYIKCSDSK